MHRPGSHCSIVARKRSNVRGAKGGRSPKALAAVGPGMPITFIRTLTEEVSNYFTQQRLIARLTSVFGILSLPLAHVCAFCGSPYS